MILCQNRDVNALRYTVRRINCFYPQAAILAVKPKGTTRGETAEMKQHCPVTAGQVTDQSLINAGMKKTAAAWNFIVHEGAIVRARLHKRYETILQDENDVIFPIVDGRYDFVEGTTNGMLLSKALWASVGAFENECDLFLAKALWALEAKEKGATFRALLGARVS